MEKQVTIITTYPLVEEPVIKNRLLPFVSELAKRGYKIDIFQPKGAIHKFEFDNINIHFVKGQTANKNSFIARAFSEIFLCFRLILCCKKNKKTNEIVIVTIPSMFLLLILPFIKSKHLLLDVRDLTWEYLSSDNILQRFVRFCFRKIFLFTSNSASYISVTNKNELDYLETLNLNMDKVCLVTNGITENQFKSLSDIGSSLFFDKNRLRITYVGNVGLAQDLSILVLAARDNPDCDFFIVGGGNDLERIRNLNESNLSNLHLIGRVEWEKVKSYYTKSDILFAQLTNGYDTAIPSKLYEYLSVGKLVVYGGSENVKEHMKNFTGVYYFEPGCLAGLNKLLNEYKLKLPNIDVVHNRSLIKSSFIREQAVAKYISKIGLI